MLLQWRDIPVCRMLTGLLAISAALLAPERRSLWLMAAGIMLHMMVRLRSTPLLITIISPVVFAPSTTIWPAHQLMALAAYCAFFVLYELEVLPAPALAADGDRL